MSSTQAVSIHAPHAGRDPASPQAPPSSRRFNPRAPCGARPSSSIRLSPSFRFNPRAPCGARPRLSLRDGCNAHVSIHAPHAGRDRDVEAVLDVALVSIHAPHAGRDITCRFAPPPPRRFQSTRPMRGATAQTVLEVIARNVSIHAPHAGRDDFSAPSPAMCPCFNPRAPCGARPRRH